MTVKRKHVQNFRDLRFTDVLETDETGNGTYFRSSKFKKSIRATKKPW